MTTSQPGGPSRRSFLTGSAAAMGSLVSASGISAQETPVARASSSVDIRDFGAVGDARTDDIDAIQAAIDSLGSDGGTVRIPHGSYRISGSILLRSSIELVGESLNSAILAQTPDSAIRVADSSTVNYDIHLRHLTIRNEAGTPIGVDARYMTGCGIEMCWIERFDEVGVLYGGNTDSSNASWSNTMSRSTVQLSPTCIRFDGEHASGGSPANWMSIERCMIIPTDAPTSIGIDLVNGDTVRIVDNDISYAPSATGIVIRRHIYGQLEYNRFERIGSTGASHPIEKEFGFSNFHVTGLLTQMHYQPADVIRIAGDIGTGSFRLQWSDDVTGDIAFSTDNVELAGNITAALEALPTIGPGNVDVLASAQKTLQVGWRNGWGRSDRPELTIESTDLDGDGSITVARGSTADAIRIAADIVLAATMNGTAEEQQSVQSEHLDIGIPVVARDSIVAIHPPGTASLRLQRNDEPYPRMDISVDGRVRWTDPTDGGEIGALSVKRTADDDPQLTWTAAGTPLRLFAGFTVAAELAFDTIDPGDIAVASIDAVGARPGDAAMVIPPSTLPQGLSATAVVVENDAVEIRVANVSSEDRRSNEASWSVLILKTAG